MPSIRDGGESENADEKEGLKRVATTRSLYNFEYNQQTFNFLIFSIPFVDECRQEVRITGAESSVIWSRGEGRLGAG